MQEQVYFEEARAGLLKSYSEAAVEAMLPAMRYGATEIFPDKLIEARNDLPEDEAVARAFYETVKTMAVIAADDGTDELYSNLRLILKHPGSDTHHAFDGAAKYIRTVGRFTAQFA